MSTITTTSARVSPASKQAVAAAVAAVMSHSHNTTISSTTFSSSPSPLPSSSVSTSSRLRLKIDDRWYDLAKWQHQHPGGSAILQHMNGQDATDAFYSLHSVEAAQRLSKMYSTPAKPNDTLPPTPATLAFRELRAQLFAEGYFNRSIFWELFYHFSVYALAAFGTYVGVHGHPLLAILFVGLSMQQSGWIGHDYVHGRGQLHYWLGRCMPGLINGFSPTWWSNKHNTHHVYTNHVGLDVDIENDPVFHLFFPAPSDDHIFRQLQHYYFYIVGSALFASWRIQSLQHSLLTGKWSEVAVILCNYAWLCCLGWQVALGSVFLAGFLVAVIVTATHQSEDILHYNPSTDGSIVTSVPVESVPPTAGALLGDSENSVGGSSIVSSSSYSFVEAQFATTRDARCGNNFLMSWLWGGMQYQLEHHLFPTMPKYYYSELAPRIEIWAKQNGIIYRADTVWQIWKRNFLTLKFYAGEAPDCKQE